MRIVAYSIGLALIQSPAPVPATVDAPTVKVLKGLTVPEYKPAEGESRLGRVTCFTCHQGELRPTSTP
jgi:hypothetical protein